MCDPQMAMQAYGNMADGARMAPPNPMVKPREMPPAPMTAPIDPRTLARFPDAALMQPPFPSYPVSHDARGRRVVWGADADGLRYARGDQGEPWSGLLYRSREREQQNQMDGNSVGAEVAGQSANEYLDQVIARKRYLQLLGGDASAP